ncbi:site-specific integrase [Roseomonas frigidaquae]|uniref:Site-specific integrase n=1 Tax=Falsiroseomonas frigidaquae TaxID=487318 RepID=A0ABX1F8V6_9PROT|nr:site-specific integrase [Falsiroseomonas frigidaquae]NKE48670.1 site-specific integrase [Falsiroseomonas frigidaquae]
MHDYGTPLGIQVIDAAAPPAPLGRPPATVARWFDAAAEAVPPTSDGTLAGDQAAAEAFRRLATARNTRSAYRSAVRAWCAWCLLHDRQALPATVADVAAFLAGERARGLAAPTLVLRRAALRFLHRAAGLPTPTDDIRVAQTLAGIARAAAAAGETPRKVTAATDALLRQVLAPIPDDLRGLRDRALLIVGFAGALRRAEIAAIEVERLVPTERGLVLELPQTKGSQAAAVRIPLPYGSTELCPVRAIARWRAAAAIDAGPLFRRIWAPGPARLSRIPPRPRIGDAPLSLQSVGDIVQARAAAAGFDPAAFGGHSLRRGALTTGMNRGVHPAQLKRLGRHKRFDTLGEYLEFGDLFEGHPLAGSL